MSVAVAVVGATGRMGRLVIDVVTSLPGFHICAGLNSSSPLSELEGADIVVDVTTPSASPDVVTAALDRGAKVLVGTSGWSAERLQGLRASVEGRPGAAAMVVPNFSLGSVLGTYLAAVAAQYFDSVEIVEIHHVGKADSPSGTAMRTAERIAEVRGGDVLAPHQNQVARGQSVAGIPVHSLRLQGVVAKQEVIFGGQAESLTISHDTTSPDAYRDGIARALAALVTSTGLTVGLEGVLGLGVDTDSDSDTNRP